MTAPLLELLALAWRNREEIAHVFAPADRTESHPLPAAHVAHIYAQIARGARAFPPTDPAPAVPPAPAPGGLVVQPHDPAAAAAIAEMCRELQALQQVAGAVRAGAQLEVTPAASEHSEQPFVGWLDSSHLAGGRAVRAAAGDPMAVLVQLGEQWSKQP